MRYIKNSDDAEDILQQVFVKFWTHREVLCQTNNIKAYLYTMSKNMVLNYIRNQNSALQNNYKLVQLTSDIDDELYTRPEKQYLSELLDFAIKKLPPQQRLVISLRRQGYSNKEIAEMLNLSLNTINTHFRDSLKTLKNYGGSITSILIILTKLL